MDNIIPQHFNKEQALAIFYSVQLLNQLDRSYLDNHPCYGVEANNEMRRRTNQHICQCAISLANEMINQLEKNTHVQNLEGNGNSSVEHHSKQLTL